MLAARKAILLGTRQTPSWVLRGGGVAASLDIDFVNDRSFNSTLQTISSLLSCARAAPSNATYTNAAGTISYVAANTLRYGDVGLLVEEARTNLALQASDFTNASWTKSNMTTAKTATGPDGVVNSASTLTASAGNATALQAITSGSAARITSAYIRRRTGTGNIDLTQDNGSTWATQTVTSSWARFNITSVTSANPTVGIRIVTDTDAVDVFIFQHEVGAFVTSPIPTTTGTVARSADGVSFASIPAVITNIATAAGSMYLEHPSTDRADARYFSFQSVRLTFYKDSTTSNAAYDGTNVLGSRTEAALGVVNKTARAWSGSTVSSVIGGGSAASAAWDGNWDIATPHIGSDNGSANFTNGLIRRLAAWNFRVPDAGLQTLTA